MNDWLIDWLIEQQVRKILNPYRNFCSNKFFTFFLFLCLLFSLKVQFFIRCFNHLTFFCFSTNEQNDQSFTKIPFSFVFFKLVPVKSVFFFFLFDSDLSLSTRLSRSLLLFRTVFQQTNSVTWSSANSSINVALIIHSKFWLVEQFWLSQFEKKFNS